MTAFVMTRNLLATTPKLRSSLGVVKIRIGSVASTVNGITVTSNNNWNLFQLLVPVTCSSSSPMLQLLVILSSAGRELLAAFQVLIPGKLVNRPADRGANHIDAEKHKRPDHNPGEHLSRIADFLRIPLRRNKLKSREDDKEDDKERAVLNGDIQNGEEKRNKIRILDGVAQLRRRARVARSPCHERKKKTERERVESCLYIGEPFHITWDECVCHRPREAHLRKKER